MRVLSFDVGIKNLAWCLLETRQITPDVSSSFTDVGMGVDVDAIMDVSARRHDTVNVCWKVHDWGVWDLRLDSEDERFHPTCCVGKTGSGKDCNREPIFVDISNGECLGGLCKIHSKKTNVPYTSEDIKGVSKKSLAELRKMAEDYGIDSKGKLKKEIVAGITEVMSHRYLYKIPALKKAKTVTLGDIHDRIIQRIRDIHCTADVVLIENQPVKMNAAMKSVQMILWTTLRSRMLEGGMENPDIRFINANKKLMVIPDTHTPLWGVRIMDNTTATRLARERNYAERKNESKTRVEYLLKVSSQKEHLDWFLSNSKRDDLADCLLMCLYGACEKQGIITGGKDTHQDDDFQMEVDSILKDIGGEGSPAMGPVHSYTNPRELSPLMLGSTPGPGDVPSYLNIHKTRRMLKEGKKQDQEKKHSHSQSQRQRQNPRRVKDVSGSGSETLEVD
jgi:hypothetical protein